MFCGLFLRKVPKKGARPSLKPSENAPKKGFFCEKIRLNQNIKHWKPARRKIFQKSLSPVLRSKVKDVFLQSRFARLTNGAGRRGCATASAGEAKGKRASSLREWNGM
jgi:hypothetical protein